MPLELDSFRSAVSALHAALAKSEDDRFMATLDDVARGLIQAGVIQHFEFTYELCWKFTRRWLEHNLSPGVADGVSRRELFRLAAESRLITDVEQWLRYHEARNLTSHTYDPPVAERVYQTARSFAADAQKLLEAIEARND
ncbi:MAG: nucleotidyltransferase substrate binding protein [Vicinamibacteria bacterium]|jgi:nucleotidyltransferase substrate binding protein (TIGR01987 family)|nr:nucleotidyltransferase substrate binding protein [Vicinamibacteria bacterium]